jgi:DNA-binding MarR family transcriptional regulator
MTDSPATPSTPELGLVDAVVQLSFAVQEILGAIATEFDVSITQVRMLGVLRDREPGMLELARFLSLEKSSVTGLVDRAEQRGLVARTRGTAGDGRAVHVQLTADGRAIAQRFAARVGSRIASLVEPLSERDRKHFAKTASAVVGLYAAERGIDLSVAG